MSGTSGTSGTVGTSGTSGSSGISGNVGTSGTYVNVNAQAPINGGGALSSDINVGLNQTGTTQDGLFIWDNANLGFVVLQDYKYDSPTGALQLGRNTLTLSKTTGVLSTSSVTIPIDTYDKNRILSMTVDYVVFNISTNGYRAGTFRAVHNGVLVQYDETSTRDVGGSTVNCVFSSDITGATVFNFNVTTDTDQYEITWSAKLLFK
jgi:hypothetical protein